jgi:hypothetical protein
MLASLFKKFKPSRKVALSQAHVQGMSFEELLKQTLYSFPVNTLVLVDIDVSKKSGNFWTNLSLDTRKAFLHDIVVLRPESTKQAKEIWSSLDPEFCHAYLILGDNSAIDNRGELD